MKKVDELNQQMRLENEALLRQLAEERNTFDELKLETAQDLELMKLSVDQEKQGLQEEREILKQKSQRMERLYNKDKKAIEKLK